MLTPRENEAYRNIVIRLRQDELRTLDQRHPFSPTASFILSLPRNNTARRSWTSAMRNR